MTGTGYAAHAVDRGTSGSETLVGRAGMAPVEMMGIMSVNNTSILRIVNSSAPKDEIHICIYDIFFWFFPGTWSQSKIEVVFHFFMQVKFSGKVEKIFKR